MATWGRHAIKSTHQKSRPSIKTIELGQIEIADCTSWSATLAPASQVLSVWVSGCSVQGGVFKKVRPGEWRCVGRCRCVQVGVGVFRQVWVCSGGYGSGRQVEVGVFQQVCSGRCVQGGVFTYVSSDRGVQVEVGVFRLVGKENQSRQSWSCSKTARRITPRQVSCRSLRERRLRKECRHSPLGGHGHRAATTETFCFRQLLLALDLPLLFSF